MGYISEYTINARDSPQLYSGKPLLPRSTAWFALFPEYNLIPLYFNYGLRWDLTVGSRVRTSTRAEMWRCGGALIRVTFSHFFIRQKMVDHVCMYSIRAMHYLRYGPLRSAKTPLNSPMAGAGRPPSLLIVATCNNRVRLLWLDISYRHTNTI